MSSEELMTLVRESMDDEAAPESGTPAEEPAAVPGSPARALYDAQAKERQKASGGDKKSAAAKSVPVNLPEPIHKDARDQAGKVLGVSGKSVPARAPRRKRKRSRSTPATPRPVDVGLLVDVVALAKRCGGWTELREVVEAMAS